jgi:hypothetical protein
LSYDMSIVSRYMSNPGKEHWRTVQWIFRFLTIDHCLKFGGTAKGLIGYVDSDYAGDLDRQRSLTGYVFIVGSCGVSWKVVLQPIVALSTTEAEYMAIVEACKELIWLKGLYAELCGVDSCINLFSDSQSAIYLTRIRNFICGWSENLLSCAGREVLIKANAQAVPTYPMSCFKLPSCICKKVTTLIPNYWWGSSVDNHKIHRMRWNELTDPKKEGAWVFETWLYLIR